MNTWAAAEAKANLSDLIDRCVSEPQIIMKHGKPVSVLINYQLYQDKREDLEPGMGQWVSDIQDICTREADMDPIIRVDRSLPDSL